MIPLLYRFAERRRGSLALLLGVWLALHPTCSLRAGQDAATPKEAVAPEVDPLFHHGEWELQVMSGALFSLQATSTFRPNIDYAPVVLRLGYMADTIYGRSFLRGNDELMIEAIGAPIFTGPGNALGGISLIYRRNFLSAPGARVVPYLSGGVGGIYSDAYHDRNQRALSTPFEFDLQAGAGVRFRLAPQVTIDTEVSYRHLSNANLGEHNYGTNAVGGMVGVSFGF